MIRAQVYLKVSLAILAAFSLSGCSVVETTPVADMAKPVAISGHVHGGQQPVTGATVSIMEPGTTGYGSAPSVIASTMTDANGNYQFSAVPTCPASSGLVYLYASGGSAGSGTNGALAEALVLGPCSSLTSTTFAEITEATTVAAAYALAPFASVSQTGTGIGTSATNLQGLTNAFGASNNLVNMATGFANSATGFTGIVLPQAEVNTLANILAYCVNSNGATSPGTAPCAQLFAAATPSGGVAPVDTFQAALDIALNPANNVTTLYNLVAANGPFQTTLSGAPADWTMGIVYNGGAIATSVYGPKAVSIDAGGNAWFVTENGTTGGTLMEISPAGAYLSGMSGYTGGSLSDPSGVAIDQSGNVFVADLGPGGTSSGQLVKFDSHGNFVATEAPSVDSSLPRSVAIAADGTAWVGTEFEAAQFPAPNSLFHLSSDGTTATLFNSGTNGVAIAISPYAVWGAFSDSQGAPSGYHCCLARIDGTTQATTNVSTVFSSWTPTSIAVDRSGQVWTTMYQPSSTPFYGIIEVSNTGSFVSPQAGYPSGASSGIASGIAFDGLNRSWTGRWMNNAQASYGSLLELNDSGTFLSPGAGYMGTGAIPLLPTSTAVDGSGNVWVTGEGSLGNTSNPFVPGAVVEMIGLGAPVTTPLSVALKNGTIAQRP